MHEMVLFSVPMVFLFFFLDEKEPKNSSESAEGDQENPNGQPTCNCSSADFLPPRAGMLSGNFDQQIC